MELWDIKCIMGNFGYQDSILINGILIAVITLCLRVLISLVLEYPWVNNVFVNSLFYCINFSYCEQSLRYRINCEAFILILGETGKLLHRNRQLTIENWN